MKLTMRRVVVVLNTYTKFWGKIVFFTFPSRKGDEDYFPPIPASVRERSPRYHLTRENGGNRETIRNLMYTY